MVPGLFFHRHRVDIPGGSEMNVVIPMPNVDEFCFLPVMAGMWRQHEVWDGTYTIDDLLDAVEMIMVRQAREIEKGSRR